MTASVAAAQRRPYAFASEDSRIQGRQACAPKAEAFWGVRASRLKAFCDMVLSALTVRFLRSAASLARAFSGRSAVTHALLHPVWWFSLVVLLVNDHFLKGGRVLAGAVTGKLSDFAGMLVAPALLAVLLGVRSRQGFVVCHVAVGGVFAMLKLSDQAARTFCDVGAALGLAYKVVADPTDLVALPVLLASLWLFDPKSRAPAALRGAWRLTVVGAAKVIGILSIVATSRPRLPEPILLTPDTVYIKRFGDGLHVIDRSTGKKWLLPFQLGLGEVSIARSVVYEAYVDEVQAHDLTDGKRKWQTRLPDGVRLVKPPVDADSERIVVQHGLTTAVLDAATGSLVWQLSPDARPIAVAGDRVLVEGADALAWRALSNGALLARAKKHASDFVVHQGSVYGFAQGRLVELGQDGTIVRRSRESLRDAAWASGRFPDAVLLLRTSGRNFPSLLAIDPVELSGRWALRHEQLVEVTARLVFTHSDSVACNGALVAREASSARVLWHVPYCSSYMSLAADEGLAVLLEDDSLTARDASTGRVLWSTSLDD